MRIYTKAEQQFLNSKCRGLLLFLEQIQILNQEIREIIIEKVIALNVYDFDLEDLKLVILIVFFNIPGYENVYRQMEELFELNDNILH